MCGFLFNKLSLNYAHSLAISFAVTLTHSIHVMVLLDSSDRYKPAAADNAPDGDAPCLSHKQDAQP